MNLNQLYKKWEHSLKRESAAHSDRDYKKAEKSSQRYFRLMASQFTNSDDFEKWFNSKQNFKIKI